MNITFQDRNAINLKTSAGYLYSLLDIGEEGILVSPVKAAGADDAGRVTVKE